MKIYDVRGIGASLTGSFSGSFKGLFTGPLDGVAATSSYVEYTDVVNKPALVSGSSQVSFSGITNKPTLISGSAQIAALGYATTSTNVFQGNQTITGSLFITQNLVVAGSSSIQYITSSNLDIADNIITVNVLNPSVRFGGLGVIDSGSSPQRSGSLLFDSIKDEWIFVHQNQSVVTSSVLLMGPETYNNLGNETYLSANRLPKGSGVEHLRDSNITDTGTVVSINSNTRVTGSLNISGSLTVNGSGLVPYTGATQEVNLGVYSISANSLLANQITVNPSGTTAAQVFLKHGSSFSLPNGFGSIGSSTGNEFRLYQVSSGGVWRAANISLNSITSSATRTYTLPDADGTIALTSALSDYVTIATTQTITGAKTFNTTTSEFAGFNSTNASGGVLTFRRSGTNVGHIGNSAQLGGGVLDAIEVRSGTGSSVILKTDGGALTLATGGGVTLTGALNGTSAVFSGNVTISKSSPTLTLNAPTGTAGEYRLSNSVGTSLWSMFSVTGGGDSQGNFGLYSLGKTGGAGAVLEITPAGAATFSSSVTAGSDNSTPTLTIGAASSNSIGWLKLIPSSTQINWAITSNYTSNLLSLHASTTLGGTTFSSPAVTIANSGNIITNGSVTAQGFNTSVGTVSAATSTWVTVYTIPQEQANEGVYNVYAHYNDNDGGMAFTQVLADRTHLREANKSNGTAVTIQLSGRNIQVQQIYGSTVSIQWSVLWQKLR